MHNINPEATLERLGCIIEGKYFIVLNNGSVVTHYVDTNPLIRHTEHMWALMRTLLRNTKDVLGRGFEDIDVIVGPDTATPLIVAMAELMGGSTKHIQIAFTSSRRERYDLHGLSFKEAVRNGPCLVLNGLCSGGRSTKETGEAITQAGGTVAVYSCIWNKSPTLVNPETMGAPTVALIEKSVPYYKPADHPHWGQWPLVTNVGYPRLIRKYPGPRIKVPYRVPGADIWTHP